MVTLYHFAGAICAQKVRIALAEKGVHWKSEIALEVLRSPEYLKINPGGYVPTLVDDDRVITESRIICEYINEAFAGPALLPNSAFDRARVSLWTKQIDDSLHLNIHTLSFVVMMRTRYLAMEAEEFQRALPFDPVKIDRIHDMMANGDRSRFVLIALRRFKKLIEDIEDALSCSTWLVGQNYSLADSDYTPYMQRLTDLGLEFLWRERPLVTAWFNRLKTRKSFATSILNWQTHDELARKQEIATMRQPIFERLLREPNR